MARQRGGSAGGPAITDQCFKPGDETLESGEHHAGLAGVETRQRILDAVIRELKIASPSLRIVGISVTRTSRPSSTSRGACSRSRSVVQLGVRFRGVGQPPRIA